MKKLLLLIAVIIVLINNQNFAQSENNLSDLIFAEGNYLRNLGTFGEVWSEAAGIYIGYGMYFPEHNLLMFRTGYMNHKLRSDDQSDGSLSVLPIQIGGRYYFTNDRVMPYIQFMNGFNIVFENMNLTGVKEDRTLLRYFWQIGAGGTFSLTENINIDLGLNYNSAFYENNKELYGGAGAMMTGFEYTLGFGWKFNH